MSNGPSGALEALALDGGVGSTKKPTRPWAARGRALAFAVWVAVAIVTCGAELRAQDTSAEAEHERGVQLREAGRDEEALAVFRAIYERTREPRALARMALAEGALGRWVAADEHLREAIAQRRDRWIRQNRRGLRENQRVIRRHVGVLEVICRTPGAVLWIDGVARGALSGEERIPIDEGRRQVEIRAPGFVTYRQEVLITAAEREEVIASLQPAPPEPARVEAPLTAPSVVAAIPQDSPPVSVPAALPEPMTRPDLVAPTTPSAVVESPQVPIAQTTPAESTVGPSLPGIEPGPVSSMATGVTVSRVPWPALGAVGLGVGAALLGGGVATLLLGNAAASDYQAAGCSFTQRADSTTCRGLASDRDSFAMLSPIGFAAGGLLAATGLVFLLIPRRSPAAPPGATVWGCAPGPFAALSCAVRF
jgi:hypothetical protein